MVEVIIYEPWKKPARCVRCNSRMQEVETNKLRCPKCGAGCTWVSTEEAASEMVALSEACNSQKNV
jgi:Predicted DNA-binding protein containing a Zn-ribbon domain